MREKAVSLLRELTEAHAVPGHEDEVRAVFVKELGDCGEISCDKLGSVFCEVHGEGPRVMVAGHMDEVGFLVQNITTEGFLQIVNVGGWWGHNLLSQRVEVLTRSGTKVLGVVCSQPPHFLPAEQRKQVLTIDRMFIDVGATSRGHAEEELGISLGDPVAPVSSFAAMANPDYYLAKAFDNRVGMAGVIQAGQFLARDPGPNSLVLCGTVQEEVGLRGAKTAANRMRPDIAIVLEGPPADDTPGFNRADSQGRLGGGVQIRAFDPTAITNPRFSRFVTDLARSERIPHQVTVRRGGGTDAGSFHLANDGIPTIVLGTPARYIHSHNAIIDINDQLALLRLVVSLVRHLDHTAVDRITRCL